MSVNRGFALAVALAAIVMIAVLVTGVLFASSQESRATRTAILDQQMLSYAELVAARAIASFDASSMDSAGVGEVSAYRQPRDEMMQGNVFITKLDSTLFLVVAEAESAASDAFRLRRRVGIVVRSTGDSSGVERVVRVGQHAWTALY